VDSHLYLHPGENPATALVSLVFYSTKNKAQFVDGIAAEAEKKDLAYNAWKRCNNMVVSWIVHSVSSDIKQSILWMDKAEEIWNDLKARFFQGDLLRISDLQMEAASMKQGESTVTEYFTKLRTVWDELENFRLDPPCTCHAIFKRA